MKDSYKEAKVKSVISSGTPDKLQSQGPTKASEIVYLHCLLNASSLDFLVVTSLSVCFFIKTGQDLFQFFFYLYIKFPVVYIDFVWWDKNL